MLSVLGFDTLDDLIDTLVPQDIRTDRPLDLPPAVDEAQTRRLLQAIADRNSARIPMIGLGYHATHTPPVITRNVLQNPAWYTAYTPYQPEISQGRLEGLLTFQTLVSDLTGLPIANASLLDEPTAAAEAMALAHRAGRGHVFAVDRDLHPHTLAVLATRAEPVGIALELLDLHDRRSARGLLRCTHRLPVGHRCGAVAGPGGRQGARGRGTVGRDRRPAGPGGIAQPR